ncbi:MAG: radical SAM protein [Candidatus Binatia bacterium]
MPAIQLTSKRNQRDFAWPIASLLDEDEPTWSRIREAVAASAADPAPVYLVGGEPTLRRDCGALLAQLGAGFPERELVLLTNGRSFFYERVCDALPPVDAARLAVEVWITSTRRDVHEATVSVSESLDQADRGIRQLLARGRRTRVRLLVGRQNHTTLPEAAAQLPTAIRRPSA